MGGGVRMEIITDARHGLRADEWTPLEVEFG
jgi:hypothetical protein